MITINPYFNFKGNTEAAFNHYRSVFGGEFATLQRYKDTPEAGSTPAAEQNLIMHIALPIGNGIILMGTDLLDSRGDKVIVGTNLQLSISTESVEETDKIFTALAKGGKETMPLSDTFWGAYFGMCTDRFGVQWMVNYDKNVK
ncbi:MAG: VOC family protein [Chryseolinea sp.]